LNGESGRVLSALMMFRRFERALRHALLEENFAAILGSAVTLIVVGTLATPSARTGAWWTASISPLRP
jgi:hypothetical protein